MILGAHGVLRCADHGAFFPSRALEREIPTPTHARANDSFDCPVCLVRMHEVRVPTPSDPLKLERCPSCGGWWLDVGELERLRGIPLAEHEARWGRQLAASFLLGVAFDG